MSDLDYKLEQVLSPYDLSRDGLPAPGDLRTSSEKLIEQIKQAFIDAGYVTVDKRRYRDGYGREYMQYTMPNEYFRVPQFSYMTGQEWHDRFIAEVEAFNYEHRGSADIYLSDDLTLVAKKAANI